MNKLKIFFLIGQLSGGGAERVMSILSSSFAQHGHDVTLITTVSSDNEYPLHPNVKRIVLSDTIHANNRLVRRLLYLRLLRGICKKEAPDFLIAFFAWSLYYAVLATLWLKTKSIISVRNDPKMAYPTFTSRLLARTLLPLANAAVFQTDDARKWFPRQLQKKSIIILNPINSLFYDVERVPVPGLVVTCGRLHPQKNHKFLITAFKKVIEKAPNAILKIYGEGSLMMDLKSQIESLHLQNNVFLCGKVRDVCKPLSEASVFVLSSDYEGAPNALMEAMAVGIPCVSTDCPCGGPRMLIDNQLNGVLTPVGDINALADNIIMLLSNKELSSSIGNNARVTATRFKEDSVYFDWYNYLVSLNE